MNPYRGCEHGCIYCYARPSHAYLGYSPGLEFETEIVYKPDIAPCSSSELSKPGYQPRTLALGSNTYPYQPVERHDAADPVGARGAGPVQSPGDDRHEVRRTS